MPGYSPSPSSSLEKPAVATSSTAHTRSSDTEINDVVNDEPQKFYGEQSSGPEEDCANSQTLLSPPRRTSTINKEFKDVNKKEERDMVPKRGIQLIRGLIKYLWPDYIFDHLDWQSCKPVIRTWLVWWLMIVFMVITAISDYLGAASYLLLITAFLEHSGGFSVAAGFILTLLDIVFVFAGFMFIVIGNAIAWRIRGYPTQDESARELIQKGLCSAQSSTLELSSCIQAVAGDGYFLTTKATVVNAFAMMFALVIIGFPSTQNRLFILPWIFSAIAICVCGVQLNLFPWFDPWLVGRLIIVPMGISLAAKFFFCLTVFPESSNAKFFTGLARASRTILGIYKSLTIEQTSKIPSSNDYETNLPDYVSQGSQVLAGFGALEFDGFISRFEVCFSRLDPGNLGEFRSLIRLLVSSLSGFHFFHEGIAEKLGAIRSADELEEHPDRPRAPLKRSDTLSEVPARHGPRLKWLDKKLQRHYMASANYEIDHQDFSESFSWDVDRSQRMTEKGLDMLYTAIIEHYRELTDATQECLAVCCDWMEETNKDRILSILLPPYRRRRKQRQAKNAQILKAACDELYTTMQKSMDAREWVRSTFHAESKSYMRYNYAYSLSQDAFYGYITHQSAHQVLQLARYCVLMDECQPRPRFVGPFTRSKSDKPRFEKAYVGSEAFDLGAAGDQQHHEDFLLVHSVEKRNPDSSPPRTPLHLAGLVAQKVWRIFTSRTFYFLLKRSSVTIATASLYFFKPTARFASIHRTLWVPVMVLFTISQQAVDGVYGFLTKIFATFLGSLIGMVVWYISTGDGRGNPYGLCAALGVAMIPVAFHRHYNKQRIPAFTTVLATTIGLVVGTSWSDEKFPSSVELGSGFRVAWIRFLEVGAAVVIAFIFTVLPHTTSAKKSVRVIVGSCLERLGDLQSSISNFGIQRYKDGNIHIAPRQDVIMQKRLAIFSNLTAARAAANLIDYEPPMGGVWPKHRYQLLVLLEAKVAFLYGDLHNLLDGINESEKLPIVMKCMGWTNPHIASSVYSVFYMTCRALIAGQALPAMTPANTSEMYTKLIEELLNYEDRETFEDAIERNYQEHDGRMLLAAVTLSSYLYKHVDGIMVLVKSLVGEIFDADPSLLEFDAEAQHSARLIGSNFKPKYN